ncbi:glycosyltransferase [Peribacillus loiseleuriae]|uniref:glycosyltransferase n=1 Tax=Peribacillus loiseleuriae TaxID=1679170 RepID=UPI00382AF7D3
MGIRLKKTSIIILTYNQLPLTIKCMNSIQKHTAMEEIEMIVVDNGSTDGTVEYLEGLPFIKTHFNPSNAGFAKGCNQGLKLATGEYILFLNNDVIVTENWLDPMIELLNKKKIGMVGPVSNYVSGLQQISVDYQDIEQIDNFASRYCEQQRGKSRRVLRLVGFCLLIKQEVLDKIGSFDERFVYGSFEDDDLCLRAIQEGYQLHIALDSFIHHHGHATFSGNQDIDIHYLYHENRRRFIDKWQIDLTYFTHPRPEIVDLVPIGSRKILDVGCGAGATGLELLNRQSCQLYGIELNALVSSIAKEHYETVDHTDVEALEPSYPLGYFDTIIFADVLEHLKDPGKVIQNLSKYLTPNGSIICSIPNIAHAEALIPLLQGSWHYADAGILDRTHLRFFTPQTVHTLFPSTQFEIVEQRYQQIAVETNVELFLNEVIHLAENFGFNMDQLANYSKVYQILIHVTKNETNE